MKQRHWLDQRALLTPSIPALIHGEVTLDFVTLQRRAQATACALQRLGLVPGDHLALLLPTGIFFAELLYAAMYCGIVLIPLNTRLTASELRRQLEDVDARSLIYAKQFAALANEATASLDRAGTKFCTHEASALHQNESSIHTDANTDALRHEIELDDVWLILYTSGTTGASKGVQLSFGNFFWSAVGSALHLGAVPGERWLACLPLYHVGGLALLIRSALFGSSIVLHERFDDTKVRNALERESIAFVSLVPTMLQRVLDVSPNPLHAPSLRGILLGGAAASPDLLERARAMQLPVLPTYGLTEACSQVATLPVACAALTRDDRDHRDRSFELSRDVAVAASSSTTQSSTQSSTQSAIPQSAADSGLKPLFNVKIQIVRTNENNEAAMRYERSATTTHHTPKGVIQNITLPTPATPTLCAAGELGEIWLRGPTLTRGYLHCEESPFAGAWFKTGDLGYIDGDGALHVLDRRSDLIVSGGENVSPREVEDVLLRHPAIEDAGVAGLADADLGQTVAAWIVLQAGAAITDTELEAFCRQRLAGYKIPRRITRCRELPRSAAGKLLRRELQTLG